MDRGQSQARLGKLEWEPKIDPLVGALVAQIARCNRNVLVRRYAERIWGEFFISVRRISGKLPANFDGEF